MNSSLPSGILLIDKPKGKTAFSLVSLLRKRLGVKTIGHAGTLDPFASGVMVMLIGREFTKLSDSFLCQDKEYVAEALLGAATDTFDCEGNITDKSEHIPTLEEVQSALATFQGEIFQVPPMFSAKKINGKKLYELARKGKTVHREAVRLQVQVTLIEYSYPKLIFRVSCSKGTYIRTLAHDLGTKLGCYAHLVNLKRLRSGPFTLENSFDGTLLESSDYLNNILEAMHKNTFCLQHQKT